VNPNSKSIDDIINASNISEFLSKAKSDNTNVNSGKSNIQDPNIGANLLDFIKDLGLSQDSPEAMALEIINKKYGSPYVDAMDLEGFEKAGKMFVNEITYDDMAGLTNEDLKYANYLQDDKTGKYYRETPRAHFKSEEDDNALREYRKKSGKYAYRLKDEEGVERATIIRDETKNPLLQRLFGRQKYYTGGSWRSDEDSKTLIGNREVVPDDFAYTYTDTLKIKEPRSDRSPLRNLSTYFAELAHAAQAQGLNYNERYKDSQRSSKEWQKYGDKVVYNTPGTKEYEAHRGKKHGRGIAGDLKNEYSDLVKALTKSIPVELLFDN